jgi:hypothetical protein
MSPHPARPRTRRARAGVAFALVAVSASAASGQAARAVQAAALADSAASGRSRALVTAAPAPSRTVVPAILPVAAPAAVPQEALAPDRPGFTTSPTVLARGRRQVETGYAFSRAGAERGHALGEVLVRAAVTRDVELRVGLNSFEVTSGPHGRASGLDDAVLAAKVRLLAGGDGPSLRPETALIAGASLPSGGRAFGRRRSEPEATLAAAWTTVGASSLTINVGAVGRDAGAGARAAEYAAGAAFAWALGPHAGSYVEYFTSWAGAPGSAQRYVNTGLTLLPARALQLDAWTAVGLHRGAPDYRLGLGLVRRW